MALDDLLAKIQSAQGEAPADTMPAPAPLVTTPPTDEIPADLPGKIAAIQAAPAVPAQQEQGGWLSSIGPSLMSLVPGQSAGGWGPQNWKPPAYGASDAAVHGATLGASDIARGYAQDLTRGALGGEFNWGQGVQDVKTARDQYATEHPAANLASNLAGGVATAPLLPGAAAFRAAGNLVNPVGRWAATLGTGAGLGAGFGAAGGAIDEAPAGWEKAGEGAAQGAKWGAALGAAAPAAVGLGVGGVRAARNWLGPPSTEGNRGLVGRQLIEGSTDPNALTSDIIGPPSPYEGQIVPGSRPTTAQATGDPGLAQMERQALTDALAKPEAARTPAEAELVGRSQQQATAQTEHFRSGIDPAADPMTFKTELQSQINAMDAQHAINEAAAQQALERAQTGLGQPLPPEMRGGQVRDQLEAAKAVTKANERELWNAVDPDGTLRVDARQTAADAREIVRDIPQSAKPPEGEEAAIFQRAIMGGSALPFTEVTALRSRLLAAMREERMANGETPALRRMAMLRGSLDNTINDLAASGADAGTVARLRDASAATRQRAETFKNQFVGPLLETRGAAGDYKVPDTNVGQRIIANNESAEAHLAAGGDVATLKGALVDDLNRSLTGGELTPQKLQTWRARREGAIRAVPGLDAELGNVAGAQNLVGQLTQTRADAMTQATSGAVGRVLGGDVQPQISSILTANPLSNTGRNAASEMMRLRQAAAGNPDAEAGLQRAVMNHVDNTFIDPASGNFRTNQFLKFMREKGPALQAGLGQDAMQILRTIESDLQRGGVGAPLPAGSTKAGLVGGVSAVWQAAMQNLQKPLVQGAMATMGVLGIGGSAGVIPAVPAAAGIIGTMLARTLRANGIATRADLLAQAMNNPAFARVLAMRATPANAPLIEKGINAAMLASRAAPALSYDYGEADKRQRDQRMRQIYGLPPRGGVGETRR